MWTSRIPFCDPGFLMTDIRMCPSRCSSKSVLRDSPFNRSIGFGIRAHSSLGGIKTVRGMTKLSTANQTNSLVINSGQLMTRTTRGFLRLD